MKRIPTFLAGMFTAAVIGGLGVGALAASGAVTFNASNLMFNGQQISAKGEGYTLDNGCQAPASITYTDEKGGGTTYLPVRRISELLDVETGWDGATGSVTVGKTADTTAVPADYSDWSEEEEAAYQEFKGMWEFEHLGIRTSNDAEYGDRDIYQGHLISSDLIPGTIWDTLSNGQKKSFAARIMRELAMGNGVILAFDNIDGSYSLLKSGYVWSSFDKQ